MSSTSINEDFVRSKCQESDQLATVSHLEIDVQGDGCTGGSKITLMVVSTAFEKMPLLKRHRLVNQVFAKELENGSIHALTCKQQSPLNTLCYAKLKQRRF